MPSIETAVKWMIDTANDESHGYDQSFRTGPDYDCSSFVSAGLKAGGFDISVSNTTYTLYKVLTKLGFIQVSGSPKRGDIYLKTQYHVVCAINSSQIVHASINEKGTITGGQTGDQTGKEICITSFYEHPEGGWDYHLRYAGEDYDSIDNWISKNQYLSLSEMQNNAYLVYSYFTQQGWTLHSISALLGNMQVESNINPGLWQEQNEGNTSGGYGLVQWTPSTKITEWLSSNGYDMDDSNSNGIGQCARIQYEVENGDQWISTSEYPQSFYEFTQSTDSPVTLADMFLKNYERPADQNQPTRGVNAGYWYTYLSINSPDVIIRERKKKRYKFVLFRRR